MTRRPPAKAKAAQHVLDWPQTVRLSDMGEVIGRTNRLGARWKMFVDESAQLSSLFSG
jgi:hypothetical protein